MSACNKIVKKAFMKGGPPQYSLAHPASGSSYITWFFFAILIENVRNSDQNNEL